MEDKSVYNFFLFFSTFVRSIVDAFSIVLLVDLGYSVREILFFLFFMYVIGIFVNVFSVRFNYKFVFLVGIVCYGISYLVLWWGGSNFFLMVLFSFVLAVGNYSYYFVRHYLAIKWVDYNYGKNINLIMVISYGAVILANVLGSFITERLDLIGVGLVVLFGSLLLGSFLFFLKDIREDKFVFKKVDVEVRKVVFCVLEQFKVIFCEIQPLYLYVFVKSSKYYVGLFNVIINVASLFVMLFLVSRVGIKYFRYVVFLLGVVLVLKINIRNSVVLLLIAFLEGVGIKFFERFSLESFYDVGKNDVRSYLLVLEVVFFVSKSFFMFLFWGIGNLKVILYICVLGIVVSGIYVGNKD